MTEISLLSEGHEVVVDVDNIEGVVITVRCVSEECQGEDHIIFLTVRRNNKWKKYCGYLDPEKDFKEPKMFGRKIVEWYGVCAGCGREYEALLRVSQGEVEV